MARTILETERRKAGMSQRAVMRASGVDSSYISRAEHGIMRLYPSQAARVAEAIGWQGDPAELCTEVAGDE